MRKLTLFIATLLLTVAKTVAFEVSTSVDNPEYQYFITNGNNVKVGKNAVNSNEAGRFAFYAVEDEGVDNAYYIYSLDEEKWFDYEMKASYGGTKNFVKLSSEKGNYFVIESCAQNTAYYQIRPYNSTGVASIYLNYFQGADNSSTIGLWTSNGDGDAGSRWVFTSEINYTLTDAVGNTYEGTSEGVIGESLTLSGVVGYTFTNGNWDGNNYTATINFPFPVSKEGGVTNMTTIASVADAKKWCATDDAVIMVQTSGYDANDNNWLWAIYPQFDNGAFSFKIKSIGKDKWIYTNASGSKVDTNTNNESADGAAGAVQLTDEGTAFAVVNSQTPSTYAFHYKVGNSNQYLSINSKNDTKVYLGVHTGIHVGSDCRFSLVKTVTPPSFDGEGTAADPYLIDSADKLATLRDEVNGGEAYEGVYFKLASDITLSGEWTAIGNGSRNGTGYTGNAFKGVFDGGDNTISGLTITSTTGAKAAIGLFGVVDGGTVKNLNLTDVNINVPSSDLAGAAIGMMLNGATAEAITVSGAVVGHDGVGGIVGRLIIDGTIANCTNNASVTSSYGGIGGIVGKPYYDDASNTSIFATIEGCTNNGTITAPMYVGGIAGLARANVTNCVNEGAIVGGTQTGGIIGQLIAAGTVSGNENKAKVSGKNHLGGIIGDYSQSSDYHYYNVTIANNINRGELAATEQCAAILGCNNIDGFTAMTATGNQSFYYVEGLELFGNPEDMVIDATNKFIVPVAQVGAQTFYTFAEAAAAAQAGSEIKLLAKIDGDITVPANVTLNGNGFAISGGIFAEGDITFAGVTTAADFDANVANTAVNIPAGASLQLTGSNRLVIGHGATFNITGTIADAKTADKATLVPSLKIAAGASITGNGVTFNVNNAYIVANANTTSKNSNANGTLDFNINNSIWEQTGVLAFYVPTSGKDPVVNFELKNSVLTTTSHLVFSVTKGEVVIDNSLVNQGASRQIENRSTMTIKNGSVVNGAVATSSNAINPGTITVENATYAVTGEFSGAAEGTGTIIIKKGANVSVGSIKAGANVTVDAEGMAAGDEINFTANLSQFTGTLSVINNDKLEAQIVDGKVVLAAKPVAKIDEQGYATLNEAFAAATEGQTITLLDDATPALASQRAITKAAVIDLGGKTMTLTEDDLYFGTTTFKNGTIVVDPSVKPSTAVFWMFANQTLTFDNVKVVATGVTGTYLIGLDGNNSDLNLLNGSEILVENTTALDLDIICVNASTGNDIKVENSKVNVTNLDGRVFFRGNYTVAGNSEVNLEGITKAGFRIEAGQTLSIEGTSVVNIVGEPRDGGIHLTDLSATYTKAETATVNATVNEPKVAKVGENTYRTLAQAVAAVEDGGTITLIANETFTENNRFNNGGWWDGLGYSGDKSFTIDLAGFTISQNGALNDYLMWFKNDGAKDNTITLKNGTLDAGTTAYCALATASSNAKKITVNLENINLINNNSNGSTIKVRGGAELNVKGGTKITGKNSYLGIECVASTVNIYDGAEIYMNGTSSYNGCLVGACAAGTVNVYGGYGKGVKGGFIAMTSGGTINIEGGEWIANTDGTVGNNSNLYVLTAQSNKNESGFAGPSIINVTGGTFRGGMDAWVLNNHKDEKAELNISGGNFNANPTKYVEDDYIAVENNGVWNVVRAAAKIGDTKYTTLESAFKAATADCTIEILSDVTVDYAWDARKTGAKFTVPVTINGNGKTIKFTASVNDNNYQAPFRFEADATVKNLTIDMSEVTDNRFRAISSKGNLTVDGCKFIGKDEFLNCRAIIFGEGAGANVGNLAIAITNSEFINWKRGITDNENAQDVKTVTIAGNTLTDAGVGVSAKETVTFTGNTVEGAYVNIKSYTADNKLKVTATGNTLEPNTTEAGKFNVIDAGGKVEAEGFNIIAKGKNFNGYTGTDGIWGETWGNARESFVIKVLDANGHVMGTSTLNNVGGIINGDVFVSWNLKFDAAANTDEYWTMEWTTAPTLDNMPAKVALWVDGVEVSGGDVVLNGPDDLNKIYVIVTDAEGKITSCQTTVAKALTAAKDGDTVNLLWKEGQAPLAMNGSVFGKNVTIKGTATVDWSKGFLFVGRGGEGNATVTFDGANLTSASDQASTGIHVSGREKNTNNKYDGTLVIKNSTIELDYLINRNAIELDNATLIVKNGFGIAGRPAGETESGTDATATITLENKAKLVVNNHNGMGLGQAATILEGYGVMNVNSGSTFETTQPFRVSANGTMNIAGQAIVAGTLTNEGVVNLTSEDATLKAQAGLTVNSTVEGRDVIYANGIYTTKLGLKGKGTVAEPYRISNVDELVAFRNSVNEGETKYSAPGVWVALAADIDMAGENWIGIGSATADHGFMGNFDGKNFKFKNLTITNPALDSDGYAYAGLFGVTEGTDKNNQNTIKNLTIENVTITTTGHIAAAAIAYPYYTIVDNVKVCGDIKINGGDYTAGVLAYTRRCVNASNLAIVGNEGSFVEGNQVVGGVISDIQMNGGLTAVYNNFSAEGITVSGKMRVGGISGIIATQTLNGATVKNVTLNSEDKFAGVVAGCLGGTSTITGVVAENVTGATTLIGATYDAPKAVQAKIGDTYYATLEAAYKAAQEGETITMLAPVVIASGETLTLDKNVTVVYTSNVAGEDMFTNRGTLNISAGTITYANTDATASNVTVSTISSEPGSVLNITGGTVENKTVKADGSSIYSFAIDMLTNGNLGDVTATIAGGTVSSDYMAIRQFNNGTACKNTLNITGGHIYGAKRAVQVHLNNNAAYTTISGGKVEAGADGYAICNFAATGNLEVTGGEFIGAVYSARENFISGGTYNNPVEAAYCAAGYMPNKNTNGTYGVVEAEDVYASINGVTYGSLKAAVKAAKAGETITLLQNVNENVTISKNLTLDGAGKTITGMITTDGKGLKITIKNVKFDGNNNTINYAMRADDNNKLVVENCTVNNYIYGFLYANKSNDKVVVKNVTVENCAEYGAYLVAVNSASFENFTVKGATKYGIVVANAGARTVNLKNVTFEDAEQPLHINEIGTGKVTFNFSGSNEMSKAEFYTSQYVKVVAAAQVGTKVCGSLQDAVVAANDGETVKVLADVNMTTANFVTQVDGYATLVNVAGKAVTIDLNGKKVTVNAAHADLNGKAKGNMLMSVFHADPNGTLTLTDSSAEGTGTVELFANDATVYGLIVSENANDKSHPGKIIVNGGNYVADKLSDSMIFADINEVITVNGGNFRLGNVGTGDNGKPWIFNTTGQNQIHINVNGGTYNANVAKQYYTYEVKLGEGLTTTNNGDGTWTVVPAVATVGEETFGSIQEAIDAAQDGETVTLVKDVVYNDNDVFEGSMSKTLVEVAGKNIVLDMNGKNIDVTYTGPNYLLSVIHVADGAGLTVTGEGSIDVKGLNADGTAAKNIAYVFYKSGTTGYLTIENGTFHMNDAADSMVYTNGDEIVTINGGTFILDAVASQTNGFPVIFSTQGNNERQIVVNAGTFNYDINHQIRPFEPYVAPEKAVKKVGDMWTIVPAQAYVTELLGEWVTEPGTREHNVGYATVAEAIAATNNLGKTVTLVKDVELAKTLALTDKELTLDGAGHTISQADDCNNAIALFDITRGKVAINNVVFDGIKKGAVVRTVGTEFAMDNVTAQNCEHTVGQGLFRLLGQNTITNSTFKNNTCTMVMTLNFDGASDTPQVVDNCVFDGNIANGTAVLYYVKGANCTITDSEFIGNTVNCNNNGAVVYLGFQENCSVTGNLFKDNTVYDASTSTRVAGAIFFGYEAEISGNAFDNNTASNANGDVLGQVCSSLYYEGTIDLSGNYWGAEAPVYGKDYTIQHQNGEGTFALTNYYTGYTLDENGNVELSGESTFEVTFVDGQFESYTNAFDMEVASITYKRNFGGSWTPLYVPFEIPVSELAEKFEVAYINGVMRKDANENGVLDSDEFRMELIYINGGKNNLDGSSKTLKANYPYFIRSKSGSTEAMNLVLEETILYAASEKTYDCTTLSEMYAVTGNNRVMQDTEFARNQYTMGASGWTTIKKGSSLKPFRFYLTITSREDSEAFIPMSSMSIVVRGEELEDGTTLIYDVEMDSKQTVDYIYDLQGRRVLEPQKGNLYIINGKKVIF